MGWYGVDLDGTLAYHGRDDAPWDGLSIGKPIPAMVERVKQWLKQGKEIRIMTARVSKTSLDCNRHSLATVRDNIRRWCLTHVGRELPITCEKDIYMEVLYDDRAVQIDRNTGRIMAEEYRNMLCSVGSLDVDPESPNRMAQQLTEAIADIRKLLEYPEEGDLDPDDE